MKMTVKKLVSSLKKIWHRGLAWLGAVMYGHPSRKLLVIGVTGTKGKSSTTEILASIFRAADKKVAQSGTIRFQINEKEIPNLYKMSMPGRMFMQKFLCQAVDKRCDVAVIEMTSQGAAQYRHRHIALDGLVVTNISPEHIESHGSYENYKGAKRELARSIEESDKSNNFLILNGNSATVLETFSGAKTSTLYTPTLKETDWKETEDGLEVLFEKTTLSSPLRGRFNAENILLAATAALASGVTIEAIKEGVAAVTHIPGRFEVVQKQPFEVIVDYAHTPDSLEALYAVFKDYRKVLVLGNAGGGRDKWKRPVMAEIATRAGDAVILTDEDPYDEDPDVIVEEMATKARELGEEGKLTVEMDRRKAIILALKKALAFTKENTQPVAVLITGKGTDPFIMRANGSKEPWDDKRIAEEELARLA